MKCRLVVLICLLFVRPARAETLEDLDAVLQRAGSVDAFLASPALVDEYYAKLTQYFGEGKIPRYTYDALLAQMRDVGAKEPELKRRLWETEGLGQPFRITTATVSYGRKLDARAWSRYGRRLLDEWRAAAAGVDDKAAKRAIGRFTDEAAAFEAGLAGKKRADADAARREFYAGRRADPTLAAAASRLLLTKFETEGMRDKLGSGDADLILDTFNDLRNGLKKSFLRDGIDLGAATSLLQDRLPTAAQMLERQDVFPIETRRTARGVQVPVGTSGKTAYLFRPPPRRFHAIWKGIPLGECVGGGTVGGLTPRRWATAALTGTQFYHVEKDGSYQGFVQAVPMMKDGTIVGSLDLGAPVLRQKALAHDPLTGDAGSTTLYALWLAEMQKHLPMGWRGLAMGETNAIGNAGVLPTARADFSFRTSTDVGSSKDWQPLDDFGTRLAKASPVGAFQYGGNMIFDARTGQNDKLHLLGEAWRTRFADGPAIAAGLNSPDSALATAVMAQLARRPNLLPEIKAQVADLPHYPYMLEWGKHVTRLEDMRLRGQIRPDFPAFLFGPVAGIGAAMFGAMSIKAPSVVGIAFALGLGSVPAMLAATTYRHYPKAFAAELGALRAQWQAERVRDGKSTTAGPLQALRLRCRAAWRTMIPPQNVN